MFTGLPFAYMRTAMFMRVLGVPSSGKKRGIENAYKLAPKWYCKVSRYFITVFLINFSVLILSVLAGSIYMWLYE